MIYNYQEKKQTIMNDKMLSDVGKRLQLDALQQKALQDLKSEQHSLSERKKANQDQLAELRKSKYQRPLPTVLVQKHECYLDDANRILINLMAQSVALQAEQRAGERLLARLAMTADEVDYMSVLEDALYENPAAVVRVFPTVHETTQQRFSSSIGLNRRLEKVYANALGLEMEPKEKKWHDENALKLQQLGERQMAIFSEEVQVLERIHNIQNEITGIKAQDYYFDGGQLESNKTDPYLKNQF